MPTPDAIAFTHANDHATAIARASAFAGPGGRLATMPDIVDARLRAGPGDPVWNAEFVTSSAEYVGRSSGGVPIIVVAHGFGPLVDPEGSPEVFIRKGGEGREWRITREAFLALADGFYGPAQVVELSRATRIRRHAFLEMLGPDLALEDPLVRARLGRRAEEFLGLHAEMSKLWLRQRFLPTGQNSCVMSHRDARRSPYPCTDIEEPMGHPLSISPLIEYTHGHWVGPDEHVSLVTEIRCHERGDPVRVVGIRGPSLVTSILVAA